MSAPLCSRHSQPMRPGKKGTPWESVYSCSEYLGFDEDGAPLPGANQNGYCDQRVGKPALGGGKPAQRAPGRAPSPGVAPSPGPAMNARAVALEAASRVFQATGAAPGVVQDMAEQMLGWLTDDGAGER